MNGKRKSGLFLLSLAIGLVLALARGPLAETLDQTWSP